VPYLYAGIKELTYQSRIGAHTGGMRTAVGVFGWIPMCKGLRDASFVCRDAESPEEKDPMSTPITRRTFTAGSVAAILGGAAALSLPAQRLLAAQGADLASLGLPTIDITVTESALEGAPTETAAGRYLVTATAGEGVEYAQAAFMRPPQGMSAEEFMTSLFGGGPPPEASPESSPAASTVASPVSEEAEEPGGALILPTFLYQATFAGGAVVDTSLPGAPTSGQAVIDLGPGEWILWGFDPEAAQQPVIFTVTDVTQTDQPEPQADINVTYIDFGIACDGNLTAGEHVLRIENQGAQPHFLVVEKGPDDMTLEQVAELLEMFEAMETGQAATPPPTSLQETDFTHTLETGTQSIGTLTWVPATFEAGTYAAFCFFPTAGEGLPHAYHGMYTVFTIE